MSGAVARHLLTLAAGAANAFAFLALGGVFTSVVTANCALLGLHLATGHAAAVRSVAVALLGYLAGAAAGALVAADRGRTRAAGLRRGLLTEAVLLWAVAGGWLGWHAAPHAAGRTLLLFLTAVAMGCQNGSVGVTAGSAVTTAYLTGLVTSTVTAFVTTRRLRTGNVGVVLSLIAGAAAGGAACRWLRPAAPLLPALLVTAALASRLRPLTESARS
ncbi:DUF1275 family protein [Streptomyces sp. 7R007]